MDPQPLKTFNTAGPRNPQKPYMLPAGGRLPDIDDLISGEEYFILYAPRQSGKTPPFRLKSTN
jgi:hypothetical protein